MRVALPIYCLVMAVGCGKSETPPVVTVTKLPDAFRRLELLGYSHVKDDKGLWGEEVVYYRRSTPEATFGISLTKWSDGDRIKDVIVSCHTDENGFKTKGAKLRFWDEMERDFCKLFDASEDFSRAVSNLHEVKDGDLPVLRHEGRATTEDGWQIKVIDDVAHYTPQYKKEEKHWVRVGMIWATHLETHENVPASAIQEFNEQMKE